MASIVRRKKSRYWTACFSSRDGRQLKRSTKTTDRNKAMQIAVELEREERKPKEGVLTTAQLQKVLSDVSEKITGDFLEGPPTKDYLNDWMEGVRSRSTAASVLKYARAVDLFVEHLGRKAAKPISTVSAADVENFVRWRLAQGVAPSTASVDLKVLNTAFRRAMRLRHIQRNPVAAVRPPKAEASERGVFTHGEIEKLLAAAPVLEWQTLILLGYFMGARLGDCARMTWDHIQPGDGVLVDQRQKTGKKVTVPLHFHVIQHLDYLAAFGAHGFLCPKLATKAVSGKHSLSATFSRILEKAGIDLGTVQGKGIRKFNRRTFRSLRHSFNSALANGGVPEELRMRLTSHPSPPINRGYTHLEMETLKKAVAAMPLFGTSPNGPRGESRQ